MLIQQKIPMQVTFPSCGQLVSRLLASSNTVKLALNVGSFPVAVGTVAMNVYKVDWALEKPCRVSDIVEYR